MKQLTVNIEGKALDWALAKALGAKKLIANLAQDKAIDPSDASLLWTYTKHAERVHPLHTALDNYFYDCEWDGVEPSEVVTMYAFKCKDVNEKWLADFALEAIIERFDDEYGDLEDETKVTQTMKDAALAFVRAVVAECDARQVEDVGSVELELKVR